MPQKVNKKNFKEIIDEFIAMSMPFKKRILLFSLHALFYYILRFVTSGRKLNIFLFFLTRFIRVFVCLMKYVNIYKKNIFSRVEMNIYDEFFIFLKLLSLIYQYLLHQFITLTKKLSIDKNQKS